MKLEIVFPFSFQQILDEVLGAIETCDIYIYIYSINI